MAVTFFQIASSLFTLCFASVLVRAETHTVRFDNKCGHGTPQLIRGADTLSTGEDYVSNGPLSSAIAYLQTGDCGFNGENCVLVEMTLGNPTCPGCGSSSDLSLIAPHAFNVETGFSYFDGCDGQGASCDNGSCNTAFFNPNDNQVQVSCQTNNVGLLITFCGSGGAAAPAPSPTSPNSTPKVTPSKAAVTHAAPVPSTTHISSATPKATPPAEVDNAPKVTPTPSASPSPAPPKCRPNSARRRSVEGTQVNEARALYDSWHRRHQARAVHAARRPSIF